MADNVTVHMPSLIAKKRDGGELSDEEVEFFVDGVVSGHIQESQLGATMMAIYMRGMTLTETTTLTRCMTFSGETLEWPDQWRPVMVDKHSTGGVGDKVSLPLVPALAAAGVKVPMISGRALGFTGGTLDKLESIPGFTVKQSSYEMRNIIQSVGCCIVGQTEALVPADAIMYTHRDVTATVECNPLIVGSIISKKAAENLASLILDIKVGKGAIFKTKSDAKEIGRILVDVAEGMGMSTVAALTRMDSPLGRTVGNSLEVIESVECMKGKGPESLNHIVSVLGGYSLYNVGKAHSPQAGADIIKRVLQDGTALAKFKDMLIAQGVSPDVANKLCHGSENDIASFMPKAMYSTSLNAPKPGYVHEIHAMECALVSQSLGAGRARAGQDIDQAVGLQFHISVGDFIQRDSPWCTIHHNTDLIAGTQERLQAALLIQPTAPLGEDLELFLDVITK